MPVLLYCVSASPAAAGGVAGVGGAPVQQDTIGGLCAYWSDIDTADLGDHARDRALEFHRAVSAVFAATDVIRFRFPTAFPSFEELRKHLEPKAEAIASFLQQHAGQVQMEVRIAATAAVAAHPSSGTDYLRDRRKVASSMDSAAQACRAKVRHWSKDWRQRPVGDTMRCWALIGRADVGSFREAIAGAELPHETRAVVSGPWPADDFLELPA